MQRVILGTALIALAVIVARLYLSQSKVTRPRFEMIKIGMVEKEVEQILGGPAGLYTKSPKLGVTARPRQKGDPKEWWGDEGIVFIWFSAEDKVTKKLFFPYPESALKNGDNPVETTIRNSAMSWSGINKANT